MNNFREGLNALREISDPEKMKMALERITGKKLADYEGIDALVGALMGYYNGELGKIDTKFKNLSFIPVPVGGILLMYNTSNPAELYPGTTWELLPENKLLKTGSTPLQQGGSNSLKLSKANLPAEKLQIDSFQLGKGTQEITGKIGTFRASEGDFLDAEGAFYRATSNKRNGTWSTFTTGVAANFQASRTWTGMSTSATPYTTAMGSGTPISINPEHITIRAWKRLT